MSFEEDPEDFIDDDEFADVATVTPANGAPAWSFKGIFDEAFIDAQKNDAHVETGMPRIECWAASVAQLKREDQLSIKGRTFDVLQVQPDGTGFAVVMLAPA